MTDNGEIPGIPLDYEAGHFETLPNLDIVIDGKRRGYVDVRDFERWDSEGGLSNWWWVTLRRDDGVWIEGSVSEELTAGSVDQLQAMTRTAIQVLTDSRAEGNISFYPTKKPFTDPDPEPEDDPHSILFQQVDALLSAAVRHAMQQSKQSEENA